MDADWWMIYKNLNKKEEKNYVLWRIWWTICTTTIKRKT